MIYLTFVSTNRGSDCRKRFQIGLFKWLAWLIFVAIPLANMIAIGLHWDIVTDLESRYGAWLLSIGIMGIERIFIFFIFIKKYYFAEIDTAYALDKHRV